MGLLLVDMDDHDMRFVEPTILGAVDEAPDMAVDGRVSGFMPRGARNGSCCSADRSDALVLGLEPSCSGAGLLGSSLVGGGVGASSDARTCCVCAGGSFPGGVGGLVREMPSSICVVVVSVVLGASFSGGGGGTAIDNACDLGVVSPSALVSTRARTSGSFISRS